MDYRVSFKVSAQNLSLVFELMKDARGITLENVSPISANEPVTEGRKPPVYKDGKRLKGITGLELIAELTKNGNAVSLSDVQKAFAERGFAETSYSGAVSQAVTANLIVRTGNGGIQRPLAGRK